MLTKNTLQFICILLVSFFLVACGTGKSENSTHAQLESINIQIDSSEITTNSKHQVDVIAKFDDGTEQEITQNVDWVLDENLAEIDNKGGLTTKNLIDTLILQAKYQGSVAGISVSIKQIQDSSISGVSIDPSQLTDLDTNSEINVETTYSDGSIQKNAVVKVEQVETESETTKKIYLKVADQPVTLVVPAKVDSSEPLALTPIVEDTPAADEKTLTEIQIVAATQTLVSGQSTDISVQAYFDDQTTETIINTSWDVAGPISINADFNQITAASVATTTTASATVSFQEKTATLNFTINPIPVETPTLQSIALSLSSINLEIGDTADLILTAQYSDNSSTTISEDIEWSNNDPNIASVTQAGLLQALTSGNTTIDAKYRGKITSVNVSVSESPEVPAVVLESIKISNGDLTLDVGQNASLNISALYSDTTSKNNPTPVTWQSENSSVVTVSDTGSISAVAEGTSVITAEHAGKTATITITVNAVPIVLESIAISTPTLNLTTGDEVSLIATGTFTNGDQKDITNDVTWESSDTDILQIETSNGVKLITGKLSGSASISASLSGISTDATLNVGIPDTATPGELRFTISLPNSYSSDTQYTLPPVALYYDDGSFELVTDHVVWSTSNAEIVSIEGTQYVTGTLNGTAQITASHEASGKSISLTITLSSNNATLSAIRIHNAPSTMFFNQSDALNVRAVYSNGTESDVNNGLSWQSKNTEQATVDGSGIVTAKAIEGSVVIEVTYTDSNGTPFKNDIRINIVPENSFDSITLSLDVYPEKTIIEDASNFSPVLEAFHNPVGLIDGLVFLSPHTGYYIHYQNQINSEKLLLVLPELTSNSSYNQSISQLYYLTASNAIRYQLDNSDNTNLQVTIDTADAIGGMVSGQFSATLCSETASKANACHLSSNQLKLSGNFNITIENDATFSSLDNFENPVEIYTGNFDHVRQIADTYNYYFEITNPGVDYDFSTNNVEVEIDVLSSDKTTIIASSTVKSDNSGQIVSISATQAKTYLRVSYTGNENGTTFTLRNNQGELVAQGSASAPYVLSSDRMPILSFGTTDTNSSYYVTDVLPNHEYLVHLSNMIDANKNPRFASSLELADTLTGFTPCETLTDCRVRSDSGKIYIKVNGHVTTPISFDLELEYAPEHEVELEIPTIDYSGQVSYKITPLGSLQNFLFKSGMNNYWIPKEQLTPNTYYLIRLTGIQAFTSLWINNPTGSLVKTCSAGTASWGTTPLDVPAVMGEAYCIVKTNRFINGGFSLNVVGEYSGSGTPFILNISEVNPDNLYYVSTYPNAKTTELGSEQATTGMNFYRPGEDKPFTFKVPDGNNFAEKLVVLEPGESIYIQIFDAYGKGDFYSMQIRRKEFISSSGYFTINDPDEFEAGSGDNTQATAYEISIFEETHHSFSNNNENFGDEDWVKFTAPMP